MNAPQRDFRYLISVANFTQLNDSTIEKIIQAGLREPLTELLAYYKKMKFISKMSPTCSYIFEQIIQKAAEKNSYPAFLLPRLLDYPELICSFVEGFERYLYNLRFSYLKGTCSNDRSDCNESATLFLDSVPGDELSLSIKDKLYIFRHSNQEIIGLNKMYFNFRMSKSVELLLHQYRTLYFAIDKCQKRCSANVQYCSTKTSLLS